MYNPNIMSKAQFEIELEFGRLNSGKVMQAKLSHHGQDVNLTPGDNNRCHQSIEIQLPARVVLQVWDKDMNQDTKVDHRGNIVEDLFVRIKSVCLDGFKMDPNYLVQQLVFQTEKGDQIKTNYLGFNGFVEFDLVQPRVFLQVQSWRHGVA